MPIISDILNYIQPEKDKEPFMVLKQITLEMLGEGLGMKRAYIIEIFHGTPRSEPLIIWIIDGSVATLFEGNLYDAAKQLIKSGKAPTGYRAANVINTDMIHIHNGKVMTYD